MISGSNEPGLLISIWKLILKANRWLIWATIVTFCLLILVPILVLREESYLQIIDNLDGTIPAYSNLEKSGLMWSYSNEANIPQSIGGTSPRNQLLSPLHSISVLFQLFSPIWAYAINFAILHLLGFIGMLLLLNRFVFREKEFRFFSVAISACFGMLPTYTAYSGYLMATPLFMYVMISLAQNFREKHLYLLAFLIPFFGSFPLSSLFLIGISGLALFILFIRSKKIPIPFLTGLLFFIAGTLLAETNLFILQLLNSGFDSHRVAIHVSGRSFSTALRDTYSVFRFGHWQALSFTEFIFAPILLLTVVALLKKQWNFMWIASVSGVAIVSVFYGAYNWEGMAILKNIFPFLQSFDLNRLAWTTPTLWYLAFAFCILFLLNSFRIYGKILAVLLVLFQFQHIVRHQQEITRNAGKLFRLESVLKVLPSNIPAPYTFNEIFAPRVFSQVKDFIGMPQKDYRVGSVGFFPGISEYNGFYGVDGYQSIYPLWYKNKFRKAIAPQLELNEHSRELFDDWGNKAYFILGEYQRMDDAVFVPFEEGKEFEKFVLNHEGLTELNCNYLLSALPIRHPEKSGIRILKHFSDPSSPLHIFLYSVDELPRPPAIETTASNPDSAGAGLHTATPLQ